ncbi:MAG: aldehyde dehydrogenase family protein, partial [Actinomycetota bacterium]
MPHRLHGRDFPGSSEYFGQVFNPATGEQLAEVHFANADDVDVIVADSVEAAASWGSSSLSKRTEILFSFRALVASNANKLAAAIAEEHGKVLSDALGEIARGLENVEYACGLAEHLKGSFSSEVSTGVDVASTLEPLGVVAGITLFNFPVMVPLWMAANAIACGNAFLLKPSE